MSSPVASAEATSVTTTALSPEAKENQPKDSNGTSLGTSATGSASAATNTTTTTTPGAKGSSGPASGATASTTPPSAVEFEPPVACVRRILKNTLHSHTNVGKDATTAFARASGIFIIYLTACANDFARENRRQTITANDVLAAIKELEFDEFTPELTAFLEQYRESERGKKDAKAKAVAAKKAAQAPSKTAGSASTPSKNEGSSSKLSTPQSTTSNNFKGEDDDDDDGEDDGDASMVDHGDDDDDDHDDDNPEGDDVMAEDVMDE
ncbi:histone-like transcription factor CBF/NF-Y [Nitzschia inconspicua]|uniref:Histone-like transcription factor CBF/NF-Y n=1 Tax=Nitzschia inconspicua TaxID=303405 RepID=A0A9K3L0M8_9STRA|nr:histone-like transcription factor CBF/NF-Y [Nitzschia inconspicua]